jgi:hypothetical protein
VFKLTHPCKDCPFIKDGTMNQSLSEGRMKEILESLNDDHNTFHCHKTIDYGKDFTHSEVGEEEYTPSGKQQHCVGAMIYLEKKKRPNISMRIGRFTGEYDPSKLKGHDSIIDPE